VGRRRAHVPGHDVGLGRAGDGRPRQPAGGGGRRAADGDAADHEHRARDLGARATERFRALAGGSAVIGDVRGPGLFVGIDYVLDAGTREPATAACADAWQYAARRGLLCQFGGIGGNVLKFKPPLTTPDEDFEHMLGLVEDVTRFIEERVTGRVAAGV
jgi:adenosylmethionine-8-amino-7-oxononanoate aminotransferase